MAQPNTLPDGYSYQPPSYEECMGNQPPGYAQGVGPAGMMHPPPPPHTYVADTGMSDYERAKREKKKRIITIGLIVTLCIVFLFIILYIKLNLYHEAQRRLQNHHFRMDSVEESYYHHGIPQVSDQDIEVLQRHFKNLLNSVTPLGYKSEDKPTESNLETETESYEQFANDSPAVGLVNGTSD